MQDLLVEASLPKRRPTAPRRPLALLRGELPQPAQDPIEEQMYLYEAVGLLISIDSISNAERANCVKVRHADM